MANTTSGAYSFDQDFSIDEIITDAYERIGLMSELQVINSKQHADH